MIFRWQKRGLVRKLAGEHRNGGEITWRGNGGENPHNGLLQLSPCGDAAAVFSQRHHEKRTSRRRVPLTGRWTAAALATRSRCFSGAAARDGRRTVEGWSQYFHGSTARGGCRGGRGPAAGRTCRRGGEGSAAEGPCRASEDEVGQRAKGEGRLLDVLAGKEAEDWPPEVLAGENERLARGPEILSGQDEVCRRAEDNGRPSDFLSGE